MCHLSQDSRTFCTKLRGVKPFLAFASLVALPSLLWSAEIIEGEMAGCLFAPAEKVLEELNGGFSPDAAAWPLVGTYPGHRFQTGLCGTWMHLQWSEAEKPKEKCYTDIEGGLGWWRDTHFPAITPKFIMGGMGPNFSATAICRCLSRTKNTTKGKNVPTDNQCWTLFLSTGKVRGPVAFFTPFFWSQALIEHPEWTGKLLDPCTAGPNKSIQMETQHVLAILTDKQARGRGNSHLPQRRRLKLEHLPTQHEAR
jgi:hypothetical protein